MDHRDVVKRAMKAKGKTQKETAILAGYNGQSGLSMVLQRENGMRVDNLVKIMNALGYDVMIKDRETTEEWQLDMKPEQK